MRYVFILLLTAQIAQAQQPLAWRFPINRPHTGMLLGNGAQGLMVWGGGRQLNITLGRAGFWDHRGGNEFTARTTYQDLKKLLQAGDFTGVKAAFALPKAADNGFGHPQQLGGGRLEVTLPAGWALRRGMLALRSGEIQIQASDAKGKLQTLRIRQDTHRELTTVQAPAGCALTTKLVPASTQTKDQLRAAGVRVAETWAYLSPNGPVDGFTQKLPQDSSLSVAVAQPAPTTLLLTSELTNQRLYDKIGQLFDQRNVAIAAEQPFWKEYWASVPQVSLPDPVLQEIIDYGLYKQACVSPPQGVAATLQGPFMEDYQIVPWSNDYHFNINVQMMYWPALATNRLSHFGPLWTMLKGWMPQLKQNGEAFFGRPGAPAKGALMLPHAVDDRCRVVGTFWTGTIDHACTAWMAQMAWQHYRYGLDQPDAKAVLSDVAWPLLVGAFEGYYAMLEEVDDTKGGKRWSLPISVSPEYGGDGPKAWGRDASFQLAALHRICRILPEAARVMGQPLDPRWADVAKRLPPYTTIKGQWMQEWGLQNERIALWEGQDLVESHRHHAHLGGIYPFATLDINNADQRQMINNSLTTWRFRGAGGWSGWCVPWAATLLARTGQTEAAVNWMHFWQDNFTNEGRGTLHNANNNGTSIIGAPRWNDQAQNREIMQLDGGFGALNTVLDFLVQSRDDAIYVLPDRPRQWHTLSFDRIRAEGAFQVGATVREDVVAEIRVKSLAGGTLRLAHPLGQKFRVNGQPAEGNVLTRETRPGEVLTLTPL